MRTSFAAAAVIATASLVSAAPLAKRANPDIDGVILNYALTLEHLEAAFYKGGLEKYSASDFESAGYEPWVRLRLTEISSHETTHVNYLTAGLKAAGVNATAACEYSFPDTSPATFLAVAQILEGVGVSAYLGAAADITSPAYLTAAGSILTVEARHAAWIRSAANKGDAFPAAFDTPLGLSEVFSLAAGFITKCPTSNPTLPVKAFPVLTVATTGTLMGGEKVKLTYENSSSSDFVIFITGAGQFAVPYETEVTIPESAYGQLYAVISATNVTATDETVKAGPAVLEVDLSPAMSIA